LPTALDAIANCEGVRFEWNASTFGNLQYDDGGSVLWIKRIKFAFM